MNIVLFDTEARHNLLPFTFTRPVSEIRIGILTIREKWEKALTDLDGNFSYKTEDYLSLKYSSQFSDENLIINATVCPTENLAEEVANLKVGESLQIGDTIIAQKIEGNSFENWSENLDKKEYSESVNVIDQVWKIFQYNSLELGHDFRMLTRDRTSAKLSSTNQIMGDFIFAEEGVEAECAVFNAKERPIYLGKNSTVMEGSVIRGGFSLGEHSTLKLGAKIYGATTIGPHCKVGGEVNNSVIFGYSNKGHDGFLGNSVIGEWCNLGADTNNSNLKNDYGDIKIWNYKKKGFAPTGLQFCGLMMGDHSKCGINSMFNTGTVVGVSANIFGSGFPRNFLPSFSWGGAGGLSEYRFDKAMATAKRVMERRDVELTEADETILKEVFEMTAEFR